MRLQLVPNRLIELCVSYDLARTYEFWCDVAFITSLSPLSAVMGKENYGKIDVKLFERAERVLRCILHFISIGRAR